MFKILLCDRDLKNLVNNELISYKVDIANCLDDIYKLTYENNYDIYIVNFHYYKSIEILKKAEDKTICIFIDEYYNINNLKKAFEIGDDYIIKPFNPAELKIKIDYQIKKLYNYTKDIIKYKNMYFHVMLKQLYNKNTKVKLSPSEAKLLNIFLFQINKPISKDLLFSQLDTTSNGTLRVYISKLNKIGFNINYERTNFSYTLNY